MTSENYELTLLTIRFFSRIGFVVLLYQLYRLYVIFASPALKRQSRFFVRLFTSAVAFSLVLMIVEAVVSADWMPIASMCFNSVTTYVLVFYLSGQLNRIKRYTATSEYATMVAAMDNFIARFKESRL